MVQATTSPPSQPDGGTSKPTEDRLLLAIFTVMRRVKSRIATRHDPAQVFLLHQVLSNPDQRVSYLATCVGLDTSTVSRHVKALESSGLLARTEDPGDRRASRLTVTDAGRAVLAEAMAVRTAALAKVLDGWSEIDRDTLCALMGRLADEMGDDPNAIIPATTENR
jgi:DNA-binding MarR family transcriptional regulator